MIVNDSGSKTVCPLILCIRKAWSEEDIHHRFNKRKRIRKLFCNNKLPGHSSQVKSLYSEFYLTL